MPHEGKPFRAGRVRGYLRGRVWYLCYWESGRRSRPRVGTDRAAAKLLAAEINSQLEAGTPSALSFEKVAVPELRRRWLAHHENVRRSSVHTVRRYRAATDHLLRFVDAVRPVRDASEFLASHAEEFVAYLRRVRVSPNGHPNSAKRGLLDKGVAFIAGACRAMFGFAAKQRHLSPYAANPFAALEIDRMPVDDAKPVVLFTAEEEAAFVRACDDWQFPVMLTLMLTGLRPGELAHLVLPDDVDLEAGALRVRNKPDLGWQVKTRAERAVPVVPVLAEALRRSVGARTTGPVFLRREFSAGRSTPALGGRTQKELEKEVRERASDGRDRLGRAPGRAGILSIARCVWRDAGAITPKHVRSEFIRVCRLAGMAGQTSPKMLRHLFATSLQEGNVDWMVRMELMGHSQGRSGGPGPLGMTARYTHTRDETRRGQLVAALEQRPAVAAARERLEAAHAEARSARTMPSSCARRSISATSPGHSRSTAAS